MFKTTASSSRSMIRFSRARSTRDWTCMKNHDLFGTTWQHSNRNFHKISFQSQKKQKQQQSSSSSSSRDEDESGDVDMSDAKTIAKYYQNLENPKRKFHYAIIQAPKDKQSLPYQVLFSNNRPWLFRALSAVSLLQVIGFLLLAVVVITRPHKNRKGQVIEPLWQRIASATMLVAVSAAILFGIRYYSRFYVLEVGLLGQDTVRLVMPKIGLSNVKYVERYVPRSDVTTKDMSLLYPEHHAHSGTRIARRKKIEDYFFLQIAREKHERNYILDIGSKQTYLDRSSMRGMLGTRSHSQRQSFPYKKK